MLSAIAADIVVLLHFAFILFVLFGGLPVLRWPRLAWLHLPAAAWGALIEFAGWVCPLTPLEQWLRERAAGDAYQGGFVEHYIIPIIYPAGLTREVQIVLGVIVVALNVAVYALVLARRRGRQADP